jgi:cytochrome c
MKRAAIPVCLAILALGGPALAAGDATRGQAAFTFCNSCHSLVAGENGVGPSLHGLFGRKAGTVPSFGYSPAMTNSGIVWDEASLEKFLSDPDAMVSGTKMQAGAIADPQQRDDLAAYLAQATR